jgi:hypothetical protein
MERPRAVHRIALKRQHSGSSWIVGAGGRGEVGCRIMERADEGILDDSVISQGHTSLFMEMSTVRAIDCKSKQQENQTLMPL